MTSPLPQQMDRTYVQHHLRKASFPSYVAPIPLSPVNPFTLGRWAAQVSLAPNQTWPERTVAGWQFETGKKLPNHL